MGPQLMPIRSLEPHHQGSSVSQDRKDAWASCRLQRTGPRQGTELPHLTAMVTITPASLGPGQLGPSLQVPAKCSKVGLWGAVMWCQGDRVLLPTGQTLQGQHSLPATVAEAPSSGSRGRDPLTGSQLSGVVPP